MPSSMKKPQSNATIAEETTTSDAPSREEQIRIAAYLAAEKRGFAPGGETEDWIQAEQAIDGADAKQGADKV